MEHRIVDITEIKLVGLDMMTSLSESKTEALWKQFMPIAKTVPNKVADDFYSIQIYPDNIDMDSFTPITEFSKWAAIAVNDFDNIPAELKSISIPKGKYVVFEHKGLASDFFRTSQYIYGTWFPGSGYALDQRPHFEVMGKDYKGPNDPNSIEQVYIPIK